MFDIFFPIKYLFFYFGFRITIRGKLHFTITKLVKYIEVTDYYTSLKLFTTINKNEHYYQFVVVLQCSDEVVHLKKILTDGNDHSRPLN